MKFNKIFSAVCVLALMSGAQAASLSTAETGPKPKLDIKEAQAKNQHLKHGIENHDERGLDAKRPRPNTDDIREINRKDAPQVSSAIANDCDLNAMANGNTNTLISELTSQGFGCVSELFSASNSIQQDVFGSSSLIAVANHTKTLSTNYNGGGDETIRTLFYFIRAGWFVEANHSGISYDSAVTAATKGAIDAFVNNSHFFDNNNDHGMVLSEVITTMDNSEQQAAYIPVVKDWLSRWDQNYAQTPKIRASMYNLFGVLYRGRQQADYRAAAGSDTDLVNLLKNFALSNWMIGTDAEYLINDAGYQIGTLIYSGGSIQPTVDAALNSVFGSYDMLGNGDGIWLGAASAVNRFGDCSSYNICGYVDDLRAVVLPQTHTCSPTIKIYSQELTALQQQSACNAMGAEETLFHSMLETNNTPVADDNNSQLNVTVFNSSTDYKKYAGHIFDGMSTNNGGMYLEGNPATVGNIPNFIAYEASKAYADHYVWNLEHEYVHYLDGRYNAKGKFSSYPRDSVWWAEGVAEYIANGSNYPQAVDTIEDGSTYDLGTVFETTYSNGNEDRIYSWGYLAVRFMYENHKSDVLQYLDETRVGDWTSAQSRVDGWASSYDNEFTQWTLSLTNTVPSESPTADAGGPYSGQAGATIAFDGDRSDDNDGIIETYEWDFGDGTTGTGVNTSHSYADAGSYTVTLKVTDDDNNTDSDTASVTVSDGSTVNVLVNNTPRSISGDSGSETFYTLEVPADASDLSFSTSGGTGDGDLYVRFGSAPTSSDYDCFLNKSGNEETCDISTAQEGTYHVMVHGWSGYSTELTGSFTSDGGGTGNGSNVPDACAISSPIADGDLIAGEATCMSDANTVWFAIGGVENHSSIAITTGNGTGDLAVYYKTGGWPDASDNHGSSDNAGNDECIYLTTNLANSYWGYLKITGGASGASIIVEYDTPGCR
ncbi:MAG: collagenase [Psychrosphaera sp.]|nr:collagenase [Psychrosphaera sp.]